MTWKCRQNVGVKNESPCKLRALELFLLFIFHSGGGLRCIVKQDSVDSRDLGNDPLHEMVDQFIGKVFNGYFHHIRGIDGADDAGPVEGSLSVLYACGLEVGDYGEVLPYFAFQTVLCKFFAKDGIGFADCL